MLSWPNLLLKNGYGERERAASSKVHILMILRIDVSCPLGMKF